MLSKTKPPKYDEIIMCGQGKAERFYGHAYAFVANRTQNKHVVAIMCPSEGQIDWYPSPPTKDNLTIDPKQLEEYFDEFVSMSFYGLVKETFHLYN